MIGQHCIKSYSSTQDSIALSSGEAEYYGMVRVASQSMGLRSLLKDLGLKFRIRVLTDASAAKGIASRRGVGRVRHIEVNQLWLQDKVLSGEIEVKKVGTKGNIADILTKHIGREILDKVLGSTSHVATDTRHDIAPSADT